MANWNLSFSSPQPNHWTVRTQSTEKKIVDIQRSLCEWIVYEFLILINKLNACEKLTTEKNEMNRKIKQKPINWWKNQFDPFSRMSINTQITQSTHAARTHYWNDTRFIVDLWSCVHSRRKFNNKMLIPHCYWARSRSRSIDEEKCDEMRYILYYMHERQSTAQHATIHQSKHGTYMYFWEDHSFYEFIRFSYTTGLVVRWQHRQRWTVPYWSIRIIIIIPYFSYKRKEEEQKKQQFCFIIGSVSIAYSGRVTLTHTKRPHTKRK